MFSITLNKHIVNLVIGYIISWTYYILTLPFFVSKIGKISGATINYFISWGLLLVVFFILSIIDPETTTPSTSD